MGKKGKKGKKKKKKKKKKKAVKITVCPEPVEPKPYRNPLEPCTGVACDIEQRDETLEPHPNHYPGFLKIPTKMGVVKWDDGNVNNLIEWTTNGFKCADRILIVTPWGNYILITGKSKSGGQLYFLYDGCTCDVNIFRYYDLTCGTAGFLSFEDIIYALVYILDSKETKKQHKFISKTKAHDIASEYASKQYKAANICMKYG